MADVTTTQNSGFPLWAQDQASGWLKRAQQVADSPYQQYTGQRVASFAPWQDQAYQAQAQRAMSGSPVMNAANAQLTNTINGGNLNGNPYIDSQINQAQGDLARNWNNVQAPAWSRSMQNSGSFGNSGVMQANQDAQNQLQQNMGKIGSDMRFQNYNTERGYQQQALGMAPTFANQDYTDISQLQQAGAAYQGQNQKLLDNAYQQFTDSRDYNKQNVDWFGQQLGRINGGTQTTTSPGTSTGAQIVGGLTAGAGLYNLLFGGG